MVDVDEQPWMPRCQVAGCEAPAAYSAFLQGLSCAGHGRSPLLRRGLGLVAAGLLLMAVGAWSTWRVWRLGAVGALGWVVIGPTLIGLGVGHLRDARRLVGS